MVLLTDLFRLSRQLLLIDLTNLSVFVCVNGSTFRIQIDERNIDLKNQVMTIITGYIQIHNSP